MITADRFLEDALVNPINRTILERLPELDLEQPWLVAGCLYPVSYTHLTLPTIYSV